jgi:hypothetical protein
MCARKSARVNEHECAGVRGQELARVQVQVSKSVQECQRARACTCTSASEQELARVPVQVSKSVHV